jgi:hypothetical protein
LLPSGDITGSGPPLEPVIAAEAPLNPTPVRLEWLRWVGWERKEEMRRDERK